MEIVYIEKMEDLPESDKYTLPGFSAMRTHYRATVWAYLTSSIGGCSIFFEGKEYRLRNPEVQNREQS